MASWVVRPAARGQRPVDLKAAVARHGRGLCRSNCMCSWQAPVAQGQSESLVRTGPGVCRGPGPACAVAAAAKSCRHAPARVALPAPGRRIAGPEESRQGPLRTAPLPDPAAASLPVSLRHRAAFGGFGGPAAPFAMRRYVPPAGPAAGSRPGGSLTQKVLGMSCPSWQRHRSGRRWSPVRTIPVAPLWFVSV